MAAPVYLLEFSQDALSDTTPNWTNITAYFLEGSYQRDGGGDLDDGQAGTASFVLNNIDRRFEPEYAAGAYYPNVRPLRRLRFSIDGDLEYFGFVTSWNTSWPDDFIAQQVTVSCVDGRHLLELEALPGLEPLSASTYEEVISYAQPWGYWRLGEPEGTKLVAHVRKQKTKGGGKRDRRDKRKYKRLETRAEVEGVAGPAGTYKGLPTLGVPGLILGDSDTAVNFNVTDAYARVGPLDDSDTIDRNRLSVEFWTYLDFTTLNRYIAGPNKASLANSVWRISSTANFIFTLEFTDGTSVQATGTTPVLATTLYHVVGTWDSQTARIYVNGVFDGSTSAEGKILSVGDANEYIYIGGTASVPAASGTVDEVAIYEKALEPETILAHWIAGSSRGWAQELAGDRIEDILTHDLWSTASVQSGALTVQPQMKHGQTMLEELDATMECEKPNSVFYFSGSGNPVYLGWDFGDASPYNTPQATYGENAGEIPYETLTLEYDEEIYNEVTVEADGGSPQIASDSPSQDEFRMRRYQSSGLILSDDDDAALIADTILARFAQPAQRVTSVTLNGVDSSALTEIKTREPGDLIRVKRRPAGGTAIDRVCRIKTKSVTIPSTGYPMATFTLTRGFDATLTQWRLGTVGFSELNTTAVLA